MKPRMRFGMQIITIVAAFAVSLPAVPYFASAAVINVPADQPTIQAAIDAAVDGDEVVVADGTYIGAGNEEISFGGKAITVRSASGDPSTCQIGDNSGFDFVFRFRDSETRLSRLEGFTIRNYIRIGLFSVNSSHPTIFNCTFSGGRAGIVIDDGSRPRLARCTFIENQSNTPLAVFNNSDALVMNCRFIGNEGSNAGAATLEVGSRCSFYNCAFIHNEGPFIGAIWIRGGSVVNLYNCAFVRNEEAIQLDSGNLGGNTLNVYNCLFWDNRFSNGAVGEESQIENRLNDVTNTINIDHSTLDGWTGTFGGIGNNGTDPLFVDADGADNIIGTLDDDIRLSSVSPAIDSGNNTMAGCVGVDLDLEARFEDDAGTADAGTGTAPIIDRGPYEFGSATATPDDCNNNLYDDTCEINDGFTLDCNSNNVPDECDVANGTSLDCNVNLVPDSCDFDAGTSQDCNNTGIPDECDIAAGTSLDCNGNVIPDSCDFDAGTSQDCNGNTLPDECDFDAGTSQDCNANQIPDSCDFDDGTSQDCNGNTIPDECDIDAGTSQDCNANRIPDSCDFDDGTSQDCNGNNIPDECDIDEGTSQDCNANNIPDECDITDGTSQDCNQNQIPDSCDLDDGTSQDCNGNNIPDECDIDEGTSQDCNFNEIPDSCDFDDGTSQDCNGNNIPDECDIENATSRDCNRNDVPDECDIADNKSNDVNSNAIPDECEPDCNNNETPDDWDLFTGSSPDCNDNNIPDECDLLPMLKQIAFETTPLVLDWMNSCDDCASGDVDLPWPVTISGQTFVAFEMDSNGYIELLKDGEDPYDFGSGSVRDLTREDNPDHTYLMAAYDDLSSSNEGSFGYDLQENRVVFYWYTETSRDEGGGRPNHFQIVLYADGRVQWNFIFAEFEDFDEDLFSGIYLGGDDKRLEEIAEETIPEEQSWLFAEMNDCNGNAIPDSCDIDSGLSSDCNSNTIPDECDIASGTSTDCNTNGIPDGCEPGLPDCNNNGTPDACEPDADGDGVPDECDVCPGFDDRTDADNDGVPTDCDNCPNDTTKTEPGACGCGIADVDTDNDGAPDCLDPCPNAGDSDGDGVQDCLDPCPNDPLKLDPGICGCGTPDTDADGNGFPDCLDALLAAFQQPDGEEPGPNPPDPMAMPCAPASTMTMSGVVFGLMSIRLTRRRRCLHRA